MNKGKLIVVDGSDGSGKATQLNLLKEFLLKEQCSVQTIDFPRYHESFFGAMVARYLRGEFGKLSEINPYLSSVLYAQDRAQAKEKMETWLADGNIILSNRYAPSNLAHQSGRLKPSERKKYIVWDLELEYEVNKIPKEDIVIYLYVPYKIAHKLILEKSKEARVYANGKKRDIHEKDINFLKNSEDAYLRLVKKFPHWVKIKCVDRKGKLKTREEIHEEIVKVLRKKKIIT